MKNKIELQPDVMQAMLYGCISMLQDFLAKVNADGKREDIISHITDVYSKQVMGYAQYKRYNADLRKFYCAEALRVISQNISFEHLTNDLLIAFQEQEIKLLKRKSFIKGLLAGLLLCSILFPIFKFFF